MIGATLCSGIGAPECAAPEIEWKWCAEIEPFPSAVLDARHGKPNLGDITARDFIKRAQSHGRIDLLVAGTPCQAFSVAGARLSLADERGNLTLRFVEIVHAIKPRIVLWENVPGVLSTADNAFGCFLAGLVGADSAVIPGPDTPTSKHWRTTRKGRACRWSSAGVVSGPLGAAAWRVLDAQYFGLAQRRKRVFVVFSPRNGADPAEILFEFESLRRDSPPSRAKREDVTGTISARTSGGGGLGTDFDIDGGLVSHSLHAKGGSGRIDAESKTFIAHSLRGEGFDASEDGTGRGVPLAVIPILEAGARQGTRSSNRDGLGIGKPGDPMFTLQAGKQHGITFDTTQITSKQNGSNPQPHANGGGQLAVAFQESQTGCREYGSAGTLRSNGPGHDPVGTRIREGMAVRCLTPRECERLQGFQDDYTLIQYRGKPAVDGPRYKALGNSMAVPVIRWIISRIQTSEKLL